MTVNIYLLNYVLFNRSQQRKLERDIFIYRRGEPTFFKYIENKTKTTTIPRNLIIISHEYLSKQTLHHNCNHHTLTHNHNSIFNQHKHTHTHIKIFYFDS